MSEATLALLACPQDPGNPEVAFDWLPDKVGADVRRFLAVTTKTKAPKGVLVINLNAQYPAELARIESQAAIIGAGEMVRAQTCDSYALFSLQRLITSHPEITRVALVRGRMAVEPGELLQAFAAQDQPFCPSAQDPAVILFDRNQAGADLVLSLALEIALSGAIYAHTGYLLEVFLDELQQAVRSSVMDGLPPAVPRAVAGDSLVEPPAVEA